jgi:hypothetical protein
MGSFKVSEGKTSMPIKDPIIGMNLSSSQRELVQSWGLGHFGHFHILEFRNLQFSSCHFGGFTWGEIMLGVFFKIWGFLNLFRCNSKIFNFVLKNFRDFPNVFLVNLNLLSHFVYII